MPEFIEVLKFAVSVHGVEKTFVQVRHELAVSRESLERGAPVKSDIAIKKYQNAAVVNQ
jgi:hypothetical protein